MPRGPRILLPDFPHHIIHRGHNRQVVFSEKNDYRYYLDNLKEWKEKLGCKIYAYCLMNNHVHLVVNPGSDTGNLARLMKRVAGRQTRYANKKEGRSGTLWEGRYKSSPINADQYLLACCRYIELNPLRAGIVSDPLKYPWSSCMSRTGMKETPWLDCDPCYEGLGETPAARAIRYRKWLTGTIPANETDLIREAARRGGLTADQSFIKEMTEKTGRRFELRDRGRPRKEK